MTHVFPYYTAIYAAVLGLLAALLTVNVIVNRVRAKVDFADGGVAALGQAIRAHANFAEHTPLGLLLIGLVEAFGYPALAVNGLGIVFLARPPVERLGAEHHAEAIFRASVRGVANGPRDGRIGGDDCLCGDSGLAPRDAVTPKQRDGVTQTTATASLTPYDSVTASPPRQRPKG